MKVYSESLTDVDRYIENRRHIPIEEKQTQYEHMLAYLRPFRPIDGSVQMLEVGTGTGWFPILCKMNGLNCKGLEISPQLIQFAREYGARYGVEPDIELGNVEESDIGTERYDVIIASSVFEHIEDWKPALHKMYRALKPGGLLFFESTNKFALKSGEYPLRFYGWMPNWARYRFRMMVQGPDIMKLGIDFHQFTYVGLRRAFREAGFSGVYDRVRIADPSLVKNPKKRAILEICKKYSLVRHVVLTFFEGTTFVCVK